MTSDLCIGIASRKDSYEMVAIENGKTTRVLRFPATRLGVEAIRGFLTAHARPVRLAVAGAAAVGLALTLGDVPGRESFIVASNIANEAPALAHYAGRAP